MPEKIDKALSQNGLRRVPSFQYSLGDCLFDSVSYAIKHRLTTAELRTEMVKYFVHQLELENPTAVFWNKQFLSNPAVLRDHQENELNSLVDRELPCEYLWRMKHLASDKGLWGDYFSTFWLGEYLGRPITIWSAAEGKVIESSQAPSDKEPIHLVFDYDCRHYEPAVPPHWFPESNPVQEIHNIAPLRVIEPQCGEDESEDPMDANKENVDTTSTDHIIEDDYTLASWFSRFSVRMSERADSSLGNMLMSSARLVSVAIGSQKLATSPNPRVAVLFGSDVVLLQPSVFRFIHSGVTSITGRSFELRSIETKENVVMAATFNAPIDFPEVSFTFRQEDSREFELVLQPANIVKHFEEEACDQYWSKLMLDLNLGVDLVILGGNIQIKDGLKSRLV